MGKSSQPLRVSQVRQLAQDQRDGKRVSCKLVCLFELTKFVNKSTVVLRKGFGHAINKSARGILLLLPVPLNRRQVVEIQLPSEVRKPPSTKLVEARWVRPIPVRDRVKMYLVGTRFFFELPHRQ